MNTADFTYSPEQWARIARVVSKLIGKDAEGWEFLRAQIEIEANMLINHSDPNSRLNRLGANHQARIEKMIALRDNAVSIRDSIVASHTLRDEDNKPLMHRVEANMLDACEAYINKLTIKIDFMRAPRISIRPPRIEPASNASKTNRQQLWTDLLAIWCEIGGNESGADAADFLIAASTPVIPREMPSRNAVIEWLRARRARVSRNEP